MNEEHPFSLVVWRDSVCAGDDCDAPHETVLSDDANDSLRRVQDRLLAAHYLASISGGNATWILRTESASGRPLAVFAQQWTQPRFLIDPDLLARSYIDPKAKPHLYLDYLCQIDPDIVFDCLLHKKPLPDKYGR